MKKNGLIVNTSPHCPKWWGEGGKITRSVISVKWIHKDDRGEIVCFYEDGREYTLLTTRKGFARGGCVHPRHREYFVVLKGSVRYVMDFPSEPYIKNFIEGMSGEVPNNIPHYLVALEDAITIEWGALPEEKKIKDKKLREIVDNINMERMKSAE